MRKEASEVSYKKYIAVMADRVKIEINSYNDALEYVCQVAKITQKVFYDTYEREPAGDKDSIRNEIANQCFSPFKSQRGFEKERVLYMFRQATMSALNGLESPDILSLCSSHEDLVIFFEIQLTEAAEN